MQYPVLAVANEFLDIAIKSGCKDITPMKLQKLVYFAHGWFLALTEQPLISERIEAWQYGPVIPSLYRAFKEYGNRPVDQLHFELEFGSDSDEVSFEDIEIVTPRLNPDESSEAQFAVKLIRKVWDSYGKYSPSRLSNATHVPDSPWKQVYKEGKKFEVIPDELIKNYFKGLRKETVKA
jgi:uncharacterized phage-associated protein